MRYVVVTLVWVLLFFVAQYLLSFQNAYKMRMESLGMELPPAVVWRIQIGDFLANYGWIIALLGLLASYAVVGSAGDNDTSK